MNYLHELQGILLFDFFSLLQTLLIMFRYVLNNETDYRMVLVRNENKELGFGGNFESQYIISLEFWCLNPGIFLAYKIAIVFQEISKLAHSVILTSGTLSPVNKIYLRCNRLLVNWELILNPSLRYLKIINKTGPTCD